MTMADKIAVMFAGRLQQAGTAQEVFDNPVNMMVATFIGSPPMNILPGYLNADESGIRIDVLGQTLRLPPWASIHSAQGSGQQVSVGIRPTDIVADTFADSTSPRARIDFVESMGAETFLTLTCASNKLICRAPGRLRLNVGDEVGLVLDANYLYAFDPKDGHSIIDRSRQAGDARAYPQKGVVTHGSV
jgi:multiple sugar transport system ATP-binding protein